MDETAGRQLRPSARLHRTAHLQRELVEPALPVFSLDASLADETPQVAVRADVVEAVIVNADVGQVRRHAIDCARASQLQERRVARGVELQECRAELEPLGPLGPSARSIAAFDSEHGRAVTGPPGVFDRLNLGGGEREGAVDLRQQVARRERAIQANGHFKKPLTRSQFASSRGHSASAGSCCPRPVPCGPFLKMCISAGTPAFRNAMK